MIGSLVNGTNEAFWGMQINKGKMKNDDLEIDTLQTPKRFEGRLALQERILKTFADNIPNKNSISWWFGVML